MVKVFIDGNAGTTGLEIYDRLALRSDIKLIKIKEEYRKDLSARSDSINESDITFLCLPDKAAIESVSLVKNDKTIIIDASTAHRTHNGWAYGFPELGDEFHKAIENGTRIAVPGCHASGFIALVYPLIKQGIMTRDYPVVCHSITGYSGGGKKMIAEYSEENKSQEYFAPRMYALNQEHKHLKEMQYITGLNASPIFNPIVSNYYRGMLVSTPLYSSMLKGEPTKQEIQDLFNDFYNKQKLVKIISDYDAGEMLQANKLSGKNGMEIYVCGNDDRIVLSAIYDNLGKGASGAAVQCMNISLKLPEDYTL